MTRTDKKNRECICCGKILATSQKLRQHYASTKNQCHLPITSSQPVIVPTPQVKNQGSAPVVHIQGKDRKREKPEPIPKMQALTTQIEDQMGEGGPGPST